MSDLLAEVDEAMRQERVEKFFRENGVAIIAFIVLTILLTAGLSGYRHWNKVQKEKGTTALMQLINAADFPDNIENTDLDMRGGLRGMALLRAGGAYLEQGKDDAALAVYNRAANDTDVPDTFRHLAQIMAVRLDKTENAAPLATLEPIWSDKNSPWRYHARFEAAAFLAEQGGYDQALEHLGIISDAKGLPETLYKKARALSHIYALKKKQG